jgi:hypothetical protein
MSDNDQVPIVISREEAMLKLKSILKSDSQIIKPDSRENSAKSKAATSGTDKSLSMLDEIKKTKSQPSEPPSMRARNQSMDKSGSVGIRFSQMVNLREYDGELAPETVRSTKQQPIYRVLNFRTDENDLIVDSSPSELKTNKPVKKVQLESFKITRHHLNGCIKAKSMSLDQQCYIRITTDNWVTFQETEAIDTGDESSPMLTKYHFDFIIPIPRHDKSNNDSNTNNNNDNASYSTNNSSLNSASTNNSTNSNTNNNTNDFHDLNRNNSLGNSSLGNNSLMMDFEPSSTSQTSLVSSTTMLRNLTMKGSYGLQNDGSNTSLFSIKDCPTGLEFFVVLKSLGMLYIDDNEKLKYKLKLITPRASVVPVISLGSGKLSSKSSSTF